MLYKRCRDSNIHSISFSWRDYSNNLLFRVFDISPGCSSGDAWLRNFVRSAIRHLINFANSEQSYTYACGTLEYFDQAETLTATHSLFWTVSVNSPVLICRLADPGNVNICNMYSSVYVLDVLSDSYRSSVINIYEIKQGILKIDSRPLNHITTS